MFGNQKLFFVFCYQKIENKVFLFSIVFLEFFNKIIIQTYIMIKNKVVDIKIIFKTYLKILKVGSKHFRFQTYFYSTKHQRTIFKNSYQTRPLYPWDMISNRHDILR